MLLAEWDLDTAMDVCAKATELPIDTILNL
jgi:hypothetical protein